MDLSRLSEPFPAEDIEWRVSQAGTGNKGIWCRALAYITARAIQKRLDDVCGPENWRTEVPVMVTVDGKSVFAVGLSIRCGDDWVTKWDVAEPSKDPSNIGFAAKGGFSGAMKRAGAQWAIGRYLYYLPETFAEVSEELPHLSGREWNRAKLSDRHGGAVYWWKNPSLPGWALPKEPEHEISLDELNGLKVAWKDKFGAELKNPKDLREGFARFVSSVAGDFPTSDHSCWTRDALSKCVARIEQTADPNGVDADVPFEE